MPDSSALSDALQQSPNNLSLLLLHGRTCLEQMKLDEARAAFGRVLELDPDHTDAHLALAKVLFLEGDTSGAAVRSERVLFMEPENAQAHLLLSRVYLAEGDKKKAVEHFDYAAQIDGTVSDPTLERELGRTVRDARKASPAPSPDSCISENNSGADTEEFGDEAFIDAQSDWRPETFFSPDDPNRSTLNFDDVGGMEELKEEIRLKITYPLQFPDLYKAYGRKTGGGILVYGPPGCGKTLILRAVAGEVACNYLVVGLHEVFDPYYGNPERNLHQFFEIARANAPCVMIFDDLDSLAQDRRQIRESQMRSLVNQFLHEMDGIRSENQRVLVIGATNQPWALDPAFRRPGRFDQAIFVPPPDAPARAQIIDLLAKDKPMADFNTGSLVEATEGFTGADLKWVFDRAAELALSAAIHSGKPVPISLELLLTVAHKHTPSTEGWFEGAQTHANEHPAPDGFFNEVRKFMAAPSSSKKER
jgi:AAA+ superfamily predicted ATPase